jgi:16S rRNA (guanine527-N7)-methyltransferase
VFHVKHEGSDPEASLRTYEQLLLARALPMGMVAQGDRDRLWERHIEDSMRALPHLPSAGRPRVCDMGSGAGLPGIPLAIARPDVPFTLVEVRRNRAAFLAAAVSELGLSNVSVFPRRLETWREEVDVCLARAFAGPQAAWKAADQVLAPGGRLIYWAGTSFEAERDVPIGVRVTVEAVTLARSGPLVIMARQ